MLIESTEWKLFLIEAYRQLNEGIKRNPHKSVEIALQAKIDVLGLILAKIRMIEVQNEKGGEQMPVEYGDLLKKMVQVDELKNATRRTQLASAVLILADVVKRSKEKAGFVDSSKITYAALYRKVKELQKSGELDKGFFVSKVGDDFGLGYIPSKD